MFCGEMPRSCVICRSRAGRFPFALSVSGSRFHTSNGRRDVGILEEFVCFSKHLMYAVLPRIQAGGECATLQKSWFCLAPKLLSAAELRFSHLTLCCLFFHSPGVEEH